MKTDSNAKWVEKTLGHKPKDPGLFERALTHSSHGVAHYERLEFLGDRVLGLIVANMLYDLFPHEPEGTLSRRLNALVSREICAEVAREIGVGGHAILGKQARDDGAAESGNVLGDIIEALIGALYLEAGLKGTSAFIRRAWGKRISTSTKVPSHPKSQLQEWAAAHNKQPPSYQLTGRCGPHHAPRFTVEVEIADVGMASAEGLSKQEAETAAAKALLEKLL
jgi:ribonuclease-3